MKRLWYSLALLAALCGISLANGLYIRLLADSLTAPLEQARELARQEQWPEASTLTLQAREIWQNHHFYLHTVLRHTDTDQILRTFRSALEYLEIRDRERYTSANADLVTLIRLLAEMEQASLVNIL